MTEQHSILMSTQVESTHLDEFLRKVAHTITLDPTMNWWDDDETVIEIELEEGKKVKIPRNRVFEFMDPAFAGEIEAKNEDEKQFQEYIKEWKDEHNLE